MTDSKEEMRRKVQMMVDAFAIDALEALRRIAVDPKESASNRQKARRRLEKYDAQPRSVKLAHLEKALRAKLALAKG